MRDVCALMGLNSASSTAKTTTSHLSVHYPPKLPSPPSSTASRASPAHYLRQNSPATSTAQIKHGHLSYRSYFAG